MRQRIPQLLLLTAFAMLLVPVGRAQSSETALVLVHANLIDGVSLEAIHDATIIVRGTQIESVGTKAAALPAGAEVVDVRGRWLLPGYVDAHAHLATVASSRPALPHRPTTPPLIAVNNLPDYAIRN